MSVVKFWHPAGTFHVSGKGDFPERFGPHAFDGQIGKRVPVTLKATEDDVGEPTGLYGTLLAADVAADGSGVMMTVEISDEVTP